MPQPLILLGRGILFILILSIPKINILIITGINKYSLTKVVVHLPEGVLQLEAELANC